MPPDMSSRQGAAFGGYRPMPYQSSAQPPQGGGYGYGQVQLPAGRAMPPAPSPYGPPPARSAPLYAGQQPGMMADVPHDPYAWQRGQPAVAQPGPQPSMNGYGAPATSVQPPQQQPMPPGQYPPPGPSYPMNQGIGQAPYGQPPVNQYGAMRPFAPSQTPSPVAASGYGFQGMANPQQPYGMPASANMNSLAAYQQPERPARSWLQRLFHNPRKLATVSGVGAAAVLVMVGVTALTGGVGQTPSASTFGIFGGGAKNPDELFQTALTNALQTKNFTQKVTDDNRTIERSVDVGIVTSPRITGKASIKDTATSFEAYANRDNTFVKLTKSPSLTARPALAGTWVQVRKDAALLDNSGTGGTSMDVLFTPMTALFDSFIFGNYQPADRDALLSIINDQIVYRYDPSSVVQASVDGQAVSQFKVTVSASGQQALAAKAQQIAGIDQVRISQAATIARLSGSSNSHLIVSVSNNEQRIVQVATDADKNVETIRYGGMDITQVIDRAPQPQAVWDDYARQLAGR